METAISRKFYERYSWHVNSGITHEEDWLLKPELLHTALDNAGVEGDYSSLSEDIRLERHKTSSLHSRSLPSQ